VDRNALGRAAEDLAAAELEARGATILLRNFRRRTGELDIVARERGVLVVVEVRMRSSDDYGGAAASVVPVKRARIVRTTLQLLQAQRELARLPVRFDVAVVTPHAERWQVEWIRHAFEG
jgi:putative endonuclease